MGGAEISGGEQGQGWVPEDEQQEQGPGWVPEHDQDLSSDQRVFEAPAVEPDHPADGHPSIQLGLGN